MLTLMEKEEKLDHLWDQELVAVMEDRGVVFTGMGEQVTPVISNM